MSTLTWKFECECKCKCNCMLVVEVKRGLCKPSTLNLIPPSHPLHNSCLLFLLAINSQSHGGFCMRVCPILSRLTTTNGMASLPRPDEAGPS